jgi:chloramphenicol-sensitive protein RarD
VCLQRWRQTLQLLRAARQGWQLLATTLLIATNWGVYIWSVTSNQLFEASLGYYINPLFNVFLGFIFLKESLRSLQWLAVVLAAIGVAIQVLTLDQFPWIACILAVSFGLYGLIHKTIQIDSIPGLLVETMLLLPVALLFLGVLWFKQAGPDVWTSSDWLLVILAGPVTVLPLLLFTAAAKRISYSTLGFFQYITPSILFLLATFYYREPFSSIKLLTFAFIWLALFLLSVDAIHHQQKNRVRRANV